MTTVRIHIDPAQGAGVQRGRIDAARVDATTEAQIAQHMAEDEAQAMQDAVSLVTVEMQIESLESKLDEAKLVDVLRRTMAKMSPAGRELASRIPLERDARRILALAADALARVERA